MYATESTKLYLPTSGAFRYGTFEYDILSNIERVTILLLPSSVSFLYTTTLLGPSTQFIICDVWLQGPDNGHIDIYYVNMPHADVSVSFPSIHSSNETFAIGVKNDQTLDPNDFFIEITRQSDSSSITIPQPVNTVDGVKVVYCFNTPAPTKSTFLTLDGVPRLSPSSLNWILLLPNNTPVAVLSNEVADGGIEKNRS